MTAPTSQADSDRRNGIRWAGAQSVPEIGSCRPSLSEGAKEIVEAGSVLLPSPDLERADKADVCSFRCLYAAIEA